MNLKYILNIGLGGQYNGPKAVYNALHADAQPEILFSSTVSMHEQATIERALAGVKSPREVLMVYSSKSGTTMETKENFRHYYSFLQKKLGAIDDRVIVVTSEGSPLIAEAQDRGWQVELIPKEIGGRFSVFTATGLVPLGHAGIDVGQFLEGEKAGEIGKAEEIFKYYQQGFQIHNIFLFNPELESLGKWWRQLVAESLGKDGKGILPIVSIGTNDLHSTLQLYLDGPKNIYTIFVSAKPLPPLVAAILDGVKASYQNHSLPYVHIEMPVLDAFELGKFMKTRMTEVIRVAELMHVDPYTQPAVEEYKKEARRLLSVS